ncbi:MAG: ATP-dependent DNA helicase, partial [Candidatus Pacearchaeota archaeon]
HINPSEILALTFTEKASQEMEERVDKVMPYGYTQMWISTFHSFCDRILRAESIHIGLNPSYKLLTEAESILTLRKNLFQFELDYFRPLGNPHKFLQGLLHHFNRLKDEDIAPREYIEYVKRQRKNEDKEEIKKIQELANAYKKYEEIKIKEGLMDFSDLISNTLKLFRTRKNILKSYQEKFKYILVDEFQDTNFAQNELAILLSGKDKNITVVGDDDQAIYRFRGAAVSNIIQFKKHFKNAKIITLTKNYRSTKEILESSYKLIQNNNPDRLEVKEKIDKRLISMRNVKGEKIEFIYENRVEEEAESVVRKIKHLNLNKKINYKDVAILVRANDHSQPFIRALERARIPYQFLGPGQLFHQEEIKDLIAYLKVLYNFEDSSSLYRVLSMPHFNFEPRDIAAILNFARKKNMDLFETLEHIEETLLNDKTKEKITYLTKMIKRHLKAVSKETAGQILYYFLRDSGMLKKMVAIENAKDEKKSQNIARFFDKLKTYEVENQDASVFAVVDWIDLSMQMGESPLAADIDWTENDAVNILTIHSSKGLEFPVVFLVNLVTGRFPTRERSEQIPIPQELIKEILPTGDFHLEEERRLFYVGATRARDFLFLTASNFYGEGKRERKISPFVFEMLGEKIVAKIKPDTKNAIQTSLLEWEQQIITNKEKQKEKTQVSNEVTYLSYSQIQTFDICPLHYKLRYILKIPVPQTSAQSFGTSIHAALRDFYQSWLLGQKLKIDDIEKLLEKNWIDEGYSSKAHEKSAFAKAQKIATDYLKKNFDKTNLPIALELPFNFTLENIKIGGRIDRVDKVDKQKIEIIDYKTGDNIPDEKKLAKDLQLTFYALAATEVHDSILNRKPEEVQLSLYYLEHNKKLTTTRTQEQLEEAKKMILEKAEEISKSEFLCSGHTLCKTCEYKILCSA